MKFKKRPLKLTTLLLSAFVSMSKVTTENDRNVSTKIVAATFETEIGSEEVSGEWVWKNLPL